MNIFIEHRQKILSREEKEDIEQHTATVFARLSHGIDSINISVTDVNGPKGGDDKQCTVVVNSQLNQPIIVNDTKASAPQAIRTALQRANHALVRKWKRQQLISRTTKPALHTVDPGTTRDAL